MTRDIPGGGIIFEPEPPQQCDLCGVIAELRPYGPNKEAICFECGMKNFEATSAAFFERLKANGVLR